MSFVEVAVDAPMGPNRTLSYSVPAGMEAEAGHLVWAPLGSRLVKGIIFEKVSQPDSYIHQGHPVRRGPLSPADPSLPGPGPVDQPALPFVPVRSCSPAPAPPVRRPGALLPAPGSSSLEAAGLGESEQDGAGQVRRCRRGGGQGPAEGLGQELRQRCTPDAEQGRPGASLGAAQA